MSLAQQDMMSFPVQSEVPIDEPAPVTSFPISFAAPSTHLGHCRTIKVSGLPMMWSGFNGEYDLALDEEVDVAYRRRSASMFFGALPIKPSSIVRSARTGHWEFRAAGIPTLRRRDDSEGSGPEGAYEQEDGGAAARAASAPAAAGARAFVKLVQQTPSLIARLAFPFPRPQSPWDDYSRSAHVRSALQHRDFSMLLTAKGERVPAMLCVILFIPFAWRTLAVLSSST
jgi:hypothetical protein